MVSVHVIELLVTSSIQLGTDRRREFRRQQERLLSIVGSERNRLLYVGSTQMNQSSASDAVGQQTQQKGEIMTLIVSRRTQKNKTIFSNQGLLNDLGMRSSTTETRKERKGGEPEGICLVLLVKREYLARQQVLQAQVTCSLVRHSRQSHYASMTVQCRPNQSSIIIR